jgi:hypothetical protein
MPHKESVAFFRTPPDHVKNFVRHWDSLAGPVDHLSSSPLRGDVGVTGFVGWIGEYELSGGRRCE